MRKVKWDVIVYEKQLDQWIKERRKYKENKSKIFVVIRGQCTLAMRNKLESLTDYVTLEDKDDVIGLLTKIKDLTFTTTSAQYEYWNLYQCLSRFVNCHQFENEDLSTFYRRWKTNNDVVESLWGAFVPTQLATGADKDTEQNKFQACLFLGNLNKLKYSKVIDELNNAFLADHNDYPKSVEDAVSKLQYRMDYDNKSNKKTKTPDDQDGVRENSFAQAGSSRTQLSRIKCYNCGKRGHLSPDCPDRSDAGSDAEDSTESAISAVQTRSPTPYRRRAGTAWHGHPTLG